MGAMKSRLYIANDVESAGGKLGIHSTLSFGSAVIRRIPIAFDEYWEKDLVFYAELQPHSLTFDIEAMRVACSQLICLENIKIKDRRFDSKSPDFDPERVLNLMKSHCELPVLAMHRFKKWIEGIKREDEKIVGVTDTVFFDGGRIDLLFSHFYNGQSPYGWSGLDLDSIYRGYMHDANVSLKTLGVPDERMKPHRADQDAVFLAQQGRVLLCEKMGWSV